MSFKRLIPLLGILLNVGWLQSADAQVKNSLNFRLGLTPNKCVALRKGRECFATVEVKWQVPDVGNYCLRRQSDKLQITCWRGQAQGEFLYVFRSHDKEVLNLVSENSGETLASATINVSWVYKSKRRKGRWRMF
ncbi:DUF3019 domain-containing protein [Aliikangiella coralliicola]|uniref:DUF3019 domain-containing protein n=1 Tax=Aliikangiella coralliicola TaxID=2592383 RepID=A0A545UEL7_9GAMM|nr:DUF3019 domain-containing protein [Aliikangiella coralliicola]TQV87912.1 DUF3019 domain-containing protein [Aliikangiella coralliicola]